MRRKVFRFLLLFPLVATFFLATTLVVSAQEPLPPPQPAKDYSPQLWKEYSFQAGKFRIKFPGEPRETVTTQGQVEAHSVAYKGLLQYAVIYAVYKSPMDDPKKVGGLLQYLKAGALESLRGNEIRIITERDVAVDGHKGIFMHIEVNKKTVVRFQWVVAGSSVYSISTWSRKASPYEMEGRADYEKIAAGFINSFHVLP